METVVLRCLVYVSLSVHMRHEFSILFLCIGSSPSSPPIRYDFEDEQDCKQGVRRFTMRFMCKVPVHLVCCYALLVSHYTSFSVLRAFLVEEAKIVKRVIKSQEKGGRK